MRVTFQDEEVIPSVSTGKYIVVTQHFDSPILDNVDMESAFMLPTSHQFHTLQVPQTLKSPSRLKYPQDFFPQRPNTFLEPAPSKSILRKSSYPVTTNSKTRDSYVRRNIRAFDWSIRNDIFSKSFDLPDTDAELLVGTASNVNETSFTKDVSKGPPCHIYENRIIADLEYYWTDSDSETLFTAPQSPMSIISTYLDATENVITFPDERKFSFSRRESYKNVLQSPSGSRSNDNDRRFSEFSVYSSLDSNENIKLPTLNTPSPEDEESCPIFTLADIHTEPLNISKHLENLSLGNTPSREPQENVGSINNETNKNFNEETLTMRPLKNETMDIKNEKKKINNETIEMTEFENKIIEMKDINSETTRMRKIENEILEMKEFKNENSNTNNKLKDYIIDFSSDESKTNEIIFDDDTDPDFSLIDSIDLTENSEIIDKITTEPTTNIARSDTEDSSSKYFTVGNIGDTSDVNDCSLSSNLVTCNSEDSLNQIGQISLDPKQKYNKCCPL